MNKVEGTNRKAYLDLLRIIAIILVIFAHTGAIGNAYYTTMVPNWHSYPFYLFFDTFRCINNPLFLVISGSLLLSKKESLGDLYSKRILRILLVLILASLLRYFYAFGPFHSFSEVKGFIVMLYTAKFGEDVTRYGYLYLYLGFLIILPFLRYLKDMSTRSYLYFFFVFIMFWGVFPIFQALTGISSFGINIPLVALIVFYPLVGYFLTNLPQKYFTKKWAWIMVAALFLSKFIDTFVMYHVYSATGAYNYNYIDSLTPITTFSMVYLIMYLYKKVAFSSTFNKRVAWMSDKVFGIFLLEGILREKLIFIFIFLTKYLKTFPACILYILCVFVSGLIITWGLKKIPYLKKLL